MKRFILSVLGVLCVLVAMTAPSVALDKPLNYYDYLPANTQVVITLPNVLEFKAFLDTPEIKELIDVLDKDKSFSAGLEDFRTKLMEKTGLNADQLYDQLDGDITLAILNFDEKWEPDLVFMVGMKGGTATVNSTMTAFIAGAKKDGKKVESLDVAGMKVYQLEKDAFLTEMEGHIAFANKPEVLSALAGADQKLSANPRFMNHLKLADLSNGISAFIDFEMIIKKVMDGLQADIAPATDGSTANSSNNDAETGLKMIRFFGLDKLNSASLKMPFSKDVPAKFYLHAPGYDGFFKKVFSTNPVPKAFLNNYSSESGFVSAISLQDSMTIFNAIIDMAIAADDSMSREQIETQIAAMKESMGIDFVGGFIEPLGNELGFSIYIDDLESYANLGIFGLFNAFDIEMMYSLKDQSTFSSFIAAIAAMAPPETIQFEEFGDGFIYSSSSPAMPKTATLAVNNGTLRFGLNNLETLKARLNSLSSGNTLLAKNEFKQLLATKAPNDMTSFSYSSKDAIIKTISIVPEMGMASLSEESKTRLTNLLAKFKNMASPDFSYMQPTKDGFVVTAHFNPVQVAYSVILQIAGAEGLEDRGEEVEMEMNEK